MSERRAMPGPFSGLSVKLIATITLVILAVEVAIYLPSAGNFRQSWLNDRLRVEVSRHTSGGPGITEVVMSTRSGDITISRGDGKLARFSSPGQPDRPVALKRRDVPELLAEELRRLDEDDTYASAAKRLVRLASR